MGRTYSDRTNSSTPPQATATREPQVFVVAADPGHLESVFSQCQDVPGTYTVFKTIPQMMDALAAAEKLGLAFAVIVEKTGTSVDALALRACKLEYPEVNFIVIVDECEQRCYVRFQSLGVQSILLPPFSEVSLKQEIATALPNLPQFKRHPDLAHRGSLRMDFVIPSDLSYVLGVNHLISMLLKEFSFPAPDYRINIPLACDEAITNAIVHGNASDPAKKVSIQIYISASRIKVRIKDQGPGFDVGNVGNPTEGSNLLRSSGRGVYLMRSIMDTVEYKERGRVLELEKTNTGANGRPGRENSTDKNGKH
jgi:serine/threonine-protein kinase RsbW